MKHTECSVVSSSFEGVKKQNEKPNKGSLNLNTGMVHNFLLEFN